MTRTTSDIMGVCCVLSDVIRVFWSPACDDECSGILLDDLEKIHAHFLSVNLSAVAVAPYRQLMLLENQTSGIQVNAPYDLMMCDVALSCFICLSDSAL